ncbi:MAG: pyrrolidone-carboxylate peptidase [Thermoprotei archaeon]|nr:MAG: pyrrolidone-carboxylate peptidase [Thermoprotei archaeon]
MGFCRALVTGFDWYRGTGYMIYHPNPSGIIAERLNNEVIGNCRVKGLKLSVDFAVIQLLEEVLEKYKPHVALGLGLSPRTTKPLVELVAVNYKYRVVGEKRVFESIDSSKDLIVPIQAEYEQLIKYLWSKGFDIAPSNSLGLYLCNAVAYTLYKYAKNTGSRAVFIHIPPTGDLQFRISVDRWNTWSAELIAAMAREIISYLSQRLEADTVT